MTASVYSMREMIVRMGRKLITEADNIVGDDVKCQKIKITCVFDVEESLPVLKVKRIMHSPDLYVRRDFKREELKNG